MARRVFKIRTFVRWARKAGIPDGSLCAAVDEMAQGQIDAGLGGQVFKQRIPLPGRGKRGGGRVIVGSNLQDRWFFQFGFTKNERANINPKELAALQKIASLLLAMDIPALQRALASEELTEICNEKEPNTR